MTVYNCVFSAVARHRFRAATFFEFWLHVCVSAGPRVCALCNRSTSGFRYLIDFIRTGGCVRVRVHAGACVCSPIHSDIISVMDGRQRGNKETSSHVLFTCSQCPLTVCLLALTTCFSVLTASCPNAVASFPHSFPMFFRCCDVPML